jgi:hypothetical protein
MISVCLCLGMILLHIGDIFITPPSHLPDLFPALFAVYGANNFVVAYFYGVCWLWSLNDNEVREVQQAVTQNLVETKQIKPQEKKISPKQKNKKKQL